jgi:hypothetical protein
MADPVAWTLVEKGWQVLDASGEAIGTVVQVTGDPVADIFDGFEINAGALSGNKYVPAERVGEIREGEVQLKLSRDEVEQLEPWTEPAVQERILPTGLSWWERFTGSFRRG